MGYLSEMNDNAEDWARSQREEERDAAFSADPGWAPEDYVRVGNSYVRAIDVPDERDL